MGSKARRMASQRMILFALVVVGAVLAQPDHSCRENEEWMDCGTCEGSCEKPNPVCTRECKPAKCYCPTHKGMVRLGYSGKCMPATECPVFLSQKAKRAAAEKKCGENEEWTDCGGCEELCENPARPCPAICHQECQCKLGYVRGWDHKCIKKAACTAHPECASTSCAAGTACVYQPKHCITTPCPQVACVPLAEIRNTPAPERFGPVHKCGANEEWKSCGGCEQLCDDGLRPCPLKCHRECQCKNGFVRGWDQKCIQKDQCTTHPDCASASCPAGTSCVYQPKRCITDPCPQVGCVALPSTQSPIAKRAVAEKKCAENERWTNCGSCEERCENPRGAEVMACTLQCRQQCECVPGFVRGWEGKCIPKAACTAHPECDGTDCVPGSRCVWDPKQCITTPCPQVTCLKPEEN